MEVEFVDNFHLWCGIKENKPMSYISPQMGRQWRDGNLLLALGVAQTLGWRENCSKTVSLWGYKIQVTMQCTNIIFWFLCYISILFYKGDVTHLYAIYIHTHSSYMKLSTSFQLANVRMKKAFSCVVWYDKRS